MIRSPRHRDRGQGGFRSLARLGELIGLERARPQCSSCKNGWSELELEQGPEQVQHAEPEPEPEQAQVLGPESELGQPAEVLELVPAQELEQVGSE